MLRAGQGEGESATAAMGELYEVYWYPLYAFLRRKGLDPDAACDHIQDVFLKLIENRQLTRVAPERGRFRSYLLTAVQHQLTGEWQRQQRQKRGGGMMPIALDALAAEERYRIEPPDGLTPEHLYDRRWALAVLDRAFGCLRREWVDAGKGPMFDGLSSFLSGDASEGFAVAGAAVGLSEGAARVTVHRLRQRYRELVRNEIAQTVEAEDRIEDEMRELLAALRR